MADQRYYSEEDRARGVTPEQLRKLPSETQREYLIDWFDRRYQDPVHETPYNGQEGGYQFVHGGPYEAHEELQNEFAGVVSDELIEEVADFIEDIDGVTEWAPGPEHPDQIERAAEALAERDREPPELPSGQAYVTHHDGAFLVDTDGAYITTTIPVPREPDFERIEADLASGRQVRFGSAAERTQRQALLDRIADLERELSAVRPAHGGMGHNQPPPDQEISDPVAIAVDAAAQSAAVMKSELSKAEPDAAVVAQNAHWLQQFGRWCAGKGDKMADEFAKSFGKTLGTTAAVALTGGALLTVLAAVAKAAGAWFQAIMG